jgi:uncharacterized protein YdiU (UPF0061 family)
MPITFDNSYARDLGEGFGLPWQPARFPNPSLLYWNPALAEALGLDGLPETARAAVFSGQSLPEGAQPFAQVYAGHQFGGFSPQLGDGRALLLGEVVDAQGQRRDIAFKGSGRTPYSRGGDGKAAVGPMLREVLVSEAMHALGVPTTRALAVVATGEDVFRDAAFPGAVLTRVAASHLRVGTFEYFAARGDLPRLRQLLRYAVARHEPEAAAAVLQGQREASDGELALALLRGVVQRQARLLAQWMHLGFIHGVMNTDNMTISGETIDYGPCAFMEAYDPATVFSSIDHQGRYAYARQPGIAQWNLAVLAQALLPLIHAQEEEGVRLATDAVNGFAPSYYAALRTGHRQKLGLLPGEGADAAPPGPGSSDALAEQDQALVSNWLDLLQAQKVDHTLAWYHLADALDAPAIQTSSDQARAEALEPGPDTTPLHRLFAEHAPLNAWLARWHARRGLGADADVPAEQRRAQMQATNPWIIPRNALVEEALAAATAGELGPFEALLAAVQKPYALRPELERYAQPASAAEAAGYQTFCGT